MKINLVIILALILVTTMVSCIPLNEHVFDDRELKLDKNNLSLLEGEYQISSTNSTSTLPSILLDDLSYSYVKMPYTHNKVVLKFLNKKRIQITIIENGKEIKKKIFRGKFKDGHFEFSSTQLSPFWLIVIGIHHNKIRLDCFKNGNLVVDSSSSHLGLLLFIPFAGSNWAYDNIEFKKIISTTNNMYE